MSALATPYAFADLAAEEAAPEPAPAATEPAPETGRAEALAEQVAAEAADQARLLAEIMGRFEASERARGEAVARHIASLTDLAGDIVAEICKGAGAEDKGAAALALFERYLKSAPDGAPARLAISASAPQNVIAIIDSAVRARGADRFIDVAADKTLAPGEARIDWRGGAMTRLNADIAAQIRSIFAGAGGADANPAKERSS